ncbi:unnamed protein product [Paramecium octaurelia]|uniref:WD40-repeat-containing domain n=1 Tax=Paramecium octaurelia TaxID=43137 RepID=A0A8S1VCJ4_PAROT|nr:unnamed protein product [Paramecium octaurelia]
MAYYIQQLSDDKYKNIANGFIDKLEFFLNNNNQQEVDFEKLVNRIILLNDSLIGKVSRKLQEFNNKSRELVLELKKTLLNLAKNDKFEINLKLINHDVKQSENCWAMAFNHSGQILASGFGKFIKIWNFESGRITEQIKLSGHTNVISCLLFSKYQDSFISGSYDNSIRCWKLLEEQKWLQSQQYQNHTGRILCFILSNDENTLFSGSNDSTIKVWSVDFTNNGIQYCYSLLKHTNTVYALSLNTSETFLVSCGQDNQIIIWMKTQNEKWVFKQIVNQSITGWGAKVDFIQDNQFIWVTGEQNGGDFICFFILINGLFEEQKNKELKLQQNNKVLDYSLFQTMSFKEKQVILFRHKFHIYFLQKRLNGQYNLTTKLQFNDNSIFGAATNDLKFLVLWKESEQKYLIYEVEHITS